VQTIPANLLIGAWLWFDRLSAKPFISQRVCRWVLAGCPAGPACRSPQQWGLCAKENRFLSSRGGRESRLL